MIDPTELSKVDLVLTRCPINVTIEIEGYGQQRIFKSPSLLDAIILAYVVLTRQTVITSDDNFQSRVTLLELDAQKNFVKVRVTG